MSLTLEEWAPIKRFEDYEVSTEGRVRRCKPGITWKTVRVLKPSLFSKKYLGVTLCKDGKKSSKLIHILVAKAFVPNPNSLPQVNHKDGVKSNCKASNLEWRSLLGNHIHAVKLGLFGEGVNFHKPYGKWRAMYNPIPNKEVFIGYYLTKEDALKARHKAVSTLVDVP
jgi:hypothetical protein